MKKKFTIYLFSTLTLLFAFSSINLEAQSQSDTKKPIKYKKARALQTSTAKKMAKVYEALEEVDDAGEPKPDMETVLSVLTELRNNKDELKSYDRSVMWNAWAYVYMTDGNYTPVDISAEDLKDIVDHVMTGLDREAEAQRDFYARRGPVSGTIDEVLSYAFSEYDFIIKDDAYKAEVEAKIKKELKKVQSSRIHWGLRFMQGMVWITKPLNYSQK